MSYLLEQLFWQKSMTGNIIFFIGMYFSCILVSLASDEIIGRWKIYDWLSEDAYIKELSISNNLVSMTYVYKINNKIHLGEKIDVEERLKIELTARQRGELEEKFSSNSSIKIRVDPENYANSIYLASSSDIYAAIFILVPPIFMVYIYMLIIFNKARKIYYPDRR